LSETHFYIEKFDFFSFGFNFKGEFTYDLNSFGSGDVM